MLNKRILKVNTVLSLNGLRVFITGKDSGGKQISVSCLAPFKTSDENETYIKRLESFENRKKKNSNLVFSEEYDGISAKRNIELYEYYMEKLQSVPYIYRSANPKEALVEGKEKFT